MKFLDINEKSMILNLKKKSYEQYSSDDESDMEGGGLKEAAKEEVIPESTDFAETEDKDKSNDAYRKIDITDQVYIEEFKTLRKAYWGVQTSIIGIQDFGLIKLDCVSFKKIIVKHIDKLIKYLSDHLIGEVTSKVNELLLLYKAIENKVKTETETIDEVIQLIEYIENIQKPEKELEDYENHLNGHIRGRKDFIDDLYLALPND